MDERVTAHWLKRVLQRTFSVSILCGLTSSSSRFASFPPCSQPIVSTGAMILLVNRSD